MYEVSFIVLKTNNVVTKKFESEYLARRFINKVKRSKKCRLLSYPYFRW